MTTFEILQKVKAASRLLNNFTGDNRRTALRKMARALLDNSQTILAANALDIEQNAANISPVMQDRLRLSESRLQDMAKGILKVAELPDPVGRILNNTTRTDGLEIQKISVPFGVIAIIYESRPNVTSDAAALSVMSGNACILRCGKEAHHSAAAITAALRQGLQQAELPQDCIMLVEDTSRASALELMQANGYVDLLIPRGGKGLISTCLKNATVPCIETGTGICHIYVEKTADQEKALKIIENAKTSRPSVCNAAEVCLVDREILKEFIPRLEAKLTQREIPVELRMDPDCLSFACKGIPAGPQDFDTEFLDYILAIKAVDGIDSALEHIARHSTHHSEAIITQNQKAAEHFCRTVDSAAVYVNASTRFTDGGEFGLGCEIGISTQKLHARGPMGLQELTTYKYIITGDGHTR